MADWAKPTTASTYANYTSEIDGRLDDLAVQFDGLSPTNLPTGTIRWSSTNNRWEKWNGSAWAVLSSGYALAISGGSINNSPIGATTPSTGAFTTLTATGIVTLSGNQLIVTGSSPRLEMQDTDLAETSGKRWRMQMNGDVFQVVRNTAAAGDFSTSQTVLSVTNAAFNWMGNSVWHAGNFTPGNYLPLAGGVTVTGDVQFTNTAGFAYGINGRYSDTGAGSSYAGTIWSLDTSFHGAAAGASWVPTSLYGTAWIRSGHAQYKSAVGEGEYVFVNGVFAAGMGATGLHTTGRLTLGSVTTTYMTANGDGFSVYTSNGSGQFGAQNGAYFHFYTSMPKFYFGAPVDFSGAITMYGTSTALTSTGLTVNHDLSPSGFTPTHYGRKYVTTTSPGANGAAAPANSVNGDEWWIY